MKVRFFLPISDDVEIAKQLSLEEAEVYFDHFQRFAARQLQDILAMRAEEATVVASGALSDGVVLEAANAKRTAGCIRALEIAMKERFPQRKIRLTVLKYVAEKLINGEYEEV